MEEEKVKVAQGLADAHFKVEPNLKQVFLLKPKDSERGDDPIMLLEVVDGSFAEDIFAVGFPPDPARGVPYRSAIVEVTPETLVSVQRQGFITLRDRQWSVNRELKPRANAA